MSAFKVKVPNFEGPLDLLLFFIRRDELDIYDIPIAYITQEFLNYVHLMQRLDLELAGEFIVMASTLMQIKARMLLPRLPTEEGLEDELDPRAELTKRLLEYKRFKESALEMGNMELEQRKRYYRQLFKHDVRLKSDFNEENSLQDVTIFHLIKAFQKALVNIPKKVVHNIRRVPYTIEEQGLLLIENFGERQQYSFVEIIRNAQEKIQVVVTFIALLELIRSGRVRVEMRNDFNDILLIKTEHIYEQGQT
jgi:segregation and condensation protein A